jgi:hypothetical protein
VDRGRLIGLGCLAVLTAGCSGGPSTGSSPSASAAARTTTVVVQASPAPTASRFAVASTVCGLLTRAEVTDVLGGQLISASAIDPSTSPVPWSLIDGCAYRTTTGSLDYAVTDLLDTPATGAITQVRSQLAETGTPTFDPYLGQASIGQVARAEGTDVGIIYAAKGHRLVFVTARGGDAATAKNAVLIAAHTLIG